MFSADKVDKMTPHANLEPALPVELESGVLFGGLFKSSIPLWRTTALPMIDFGSLGNSEIIESEIVCDIPPDDVTITFPKSPTCLLLISFVCAPCTMEYGLK